MRLSLRPALVGVFVSGVCPSCGSGDIRPSRESYEGALARSLGFRPYRCRSCRQHFAAVEHGWLRIFGRRPIQRIPRCPKCGSANIAESQREHTSLADRALARRPMRCLACHARYRAADRVQAFANLLSLAVLAVALWFAAGLVSGRLGDGAPGKRPPKSGAGRR